MLEIRDIQYFADGRSVVDTMGGRRFKVLDRDSKDGYATAVVEFLHDVVPEGQELVGKIQFLMLFKLLIDLFFRSSTTP